MSAAADDDVEIMPRSRRRSRRESSVSQMPSGDDAPLLPTAADDPKAALHEATTTNNGGFSKMCDAIAHKYGLQSAAAATCDTSSAPPPLQRPWVTDEANVEDDVPEPEVADAAYFPSRRLSSASASDRTSRSAARAMSQQPPSIFVDVDPLMDHGSAAAAAAAASKQAAFAAAAAPAAVTGPVVTHVRSFADRTSPRSQWEPIRRIDSGRTPPPQPLVQTTGAASANKKLDAATLGHFFTQWTRESKAQNKSVRDAKKDPFKCSHCAMRFFTYDKLSTHMENVHQTGNKNKCWDCGQVFQSDHYLKIHIETQHHSKPFHCNFCGNGFTAENYLSMHIKWKHDGGAAAGAAENNRPPSDDSPVASIVDGAKNASSPVTKCKDILQQKGLDGIEVKAVEIIDLGDDDEDEKEGEDGIVEDADKDDIVRDIIADVVTVALSRTAERPVAAAAAGKANERQDEMEIEDKEVNGEGKETNEGEEEENDSEEEEETAEGENIESAAMEKHPAPDFLQPSSSDKFNLCDQGGSIWDEMEKTSTVQDEENVKAPDKAKENCGKEMAEKENAAVEKADDNESIGEKAGESYLERLNSLPDGDAVDDEDMAGAADEENEPSDDEEESEESEDDSESSDGEESSDDDTAAAASEGKEGEAAAATDANNNDEGKKALTTGSIWDEIEKEDLPEIDHSAIMSSIITKINLYNQRY